MNDLTNLDWVKTCTFKAPRIPIWKSRCQYCGKRDVRSKIAWVLFGKRTHIESGRCR